jgi:hypothetical protein
MERLHAPGTFSDDLSSLVRSFVLRQGGAMPHAQLMEILSFAIAGPEMALSPQQYRGPLRELFAFVGGVMRRPWNVPPGDRFEAEIVRFPGDGVRERMRWSRCPRSVLRTSGRWRRRPKLRRSTNLSLNHRS